MPHEIFMGAGSWSRLELAAHRRFAHRIRFPFQDWTRQRIAMERWCTDEFGRNGFTYVGNYHYRLDDACWCVLNGKFFFQDARDLFAFKMRWG